jgi:hypothetical protein
MTTAMATVRDAWAPVMLDPTPVQRITDFGGAGYVKREDLFRPFPGSTVNGAKLRQVMALMAAGDIAGVAAGAVQGSPQHRMVAECAERLGVPCVLFTGGKARPDGVPASATVEHVNPGYAGTLNARALGHTLRHPGWLHIETNITLDHRHHPPAAIESFHRWGAGQVCNLPPQVETLIMPAGSCTSATSVLYGLTRWAPTALKRVVLLGVGHDGSRYPELVYERLEVIGQALGARLAETFSPVCWWGDRGAANSFRARWGLPESAPYELWHYDVYGGCRDTVCQVCKGGYTTYDDLLPYALHTEDGAAVAMHPRYEGKTWQYICDHPEILEPHTGQPWLYWVVAGQAT